MKNITVHSCRRVCVPFIDFILLLVAFPPLLLDHVSLFSSVKENSAFLIPDVVVVGLAL